MKKWNAVLAVFVTSAMLATTAFAQTGGGAGGGAGSAGGGAAGAAGAAAGTGSSASGTAGAGGSDGSAASTPSPATGQDKSVSDSAAGKGTTSPSASPSTAPSGSSSSDSHTMGMSTAAADYMGRHTMEGEVTKVDHKKGTMSLKTDAGTLDLHFPPPAIQNINKGDRVSVELALKPSGTASRGGTTPSASPKTGKY